MPRLRFGQHAGLPVGAPVLETLQEMPAGVKAVIKAGFATVARLPSDSKELLLKTAVQRLDDQLIAAPDEALSNTLGLNKDDAAKAVAAATLLTVLVVSSKTSPADFVDAATKAGLLTDETKEAITVLARSVERDRPNTTVRFDQLSLANRLLPSLVDFETVVDVRLAFEKGRIATSVPVAIVHIDTDAAYEELWFQMTKAQTERLCKGLNDLLKDLEQAEHVASSAATVNK